MSSAETSTPKPPKLKEIGFEESDKRASTGKFKVVAIIDSCLYQIGKEVDTIAEARELCARIKPGHFTQVFDHKGQRYVLYPAPELKEIGVYPEDRYASTGKFRAVTLIDSCPYQIGEDQDTVDEAEKLCEAVRRSPDQFFQIYSNQGFTFL